MSRFPLLIFVCAIALSSAPGAQTSGRVSGDSLKMAGDLLGSAMAYRDALADATPEEQGALAFAIASSLALQAQYPDSAFYYLAIALDDEPSMRPLWDADFFFLTDDDRWIDVENTQLDKLELQVTGRFNREYARQLLGIRMNEWAYRYHTMLGFRTLGPESPILTAVSHARDSRHAENLVRLRALVDEHGWPELSSVGEEAAYAAGNVINHSNLATRQHFLPVLQAVCERDECDWSRYAHILDRTELELGNPQVFGTQMERNEESGRFEARPIIDPENVDVRRGARGMEPIDDQLRRFNESMSRDFGSSGG